MKKAFRVIYVSSTSLLFIMLLGSAFSYFINTDLVELTFMILGYPPYLLYPLAIYKILASIVILPFKQFSNLILKSWAYVGLFFNSLLAFVAHLMEEDGGEYTSALLALILWMVSYSTYLYLLCARKKED